MPGPRTGWSVRGGAGDWTLAAEGGTDPVDALLALCAAHWAEGGGPVAVTGVDGRATAVLEALGLSGASATVHS
jgi:hypothetical protein